MGLCCLSSRWAADRPKGDREELYCSEDFADYTRLDEASKTTVASRVGRPSVLVVENVYDTIGILQPILGDFADAIRSASSADQADALIEATADVHAEDPELGNSLFVSLIMAHMAGELRVRDDAGLLKPQQLNLIATGAAQPEDAFLALPWREAIDEFKARGLIKPDEFTRLLRGYAEASQKKRAKMLEVIQAQMRYLLEQALEDGQSLGEFADSVEEGLAPLGVTVNDPSYLQTVYRTNVQSAYGAGRFRQLEDPDIAEALPYRQYRTVNDSRVRPAHARLHNLVWHYTTAGWRRVAPPNGYNCRCIMVALSAEDVRFLEIVEDVPEDGQPDPGFDGPPVAVAA